MSLQPLYEFSRPLRVCVGLALRRVITLTGSTLVCLVILRLLFSAMVIDRREGFQELPFKEDAIAFGILTFVSIRALSTAVFARNRPSWLPKFLPAPVVFIIIGASGFLANIPLWLYFPDSIPTAGSFVIKSMIPLYIFVAITANAFIYKVEKSGKSILKYLYSITAYPVIFTAHLVVGTICMIISNIRNEGYLIEMRNLKGQERIFTEHSLLTGFFVGVLYPLVKFTVTWITKRSFVFMTPVVPQTREQEIMANATEFGFALGQNLTWDTIGYILILRSPSHFIFYASLTATYSYNAVYRIGIALWTRRKAQRRVDNIDDIKDTEKQDSPAKDSDLSKPSDTAVSFSNQGAAVKDNDPNRHIGLNAFTSSTAEKEAFQSLNAKAVRRIKSLYVNLDGVSDGRGDLRRQTTKRKPLSPSLASVAQGYSSGVDGKGVLRDQTASKTHSPSDRGTIGDVSGKDGDGNIERGFSIRRKESIQLPATSPAVEKTEDHVDIGPIYKRSSGAGLRQKELSKTVYDSPMKEDSEKKLETGPEDFAKEETQMSCNSHISLTGDDAGGGAVDNNARGLSDIHQIVENVDLALDTESIRSLPVIAKSDPSARVEFDVEDEPELNSLPDVSAPIPFTPLSASIKYAFMRMSNLASDWSSYWVACSIVLIFATLPEASKWSVTYYDVPVTVIATRFFTGSAICAFMDSVSLYYESKIMNVDFADGVRESRIAKLSWGSYIYFTGLVTCISGMFIIADTGLLYTSPTYIVGRKPR